ncbi:RAP protein, putative [Plasmodium relictum]|uniref:RAP protein, putative n=1 Tax=Plasmodium relictum TaxID=85471 RepID=A0A1J1H480_PLARL|nr:RAP protein, putative [Plasmodium relictum]CRG98408.1 RAP protein, putative [Plasmodium relictum]
MIFFFNILLLIINFTHITGILISNLNDVHSIGIKGVFKPNYEFSDFLFISKKFQNRNILLFHQNVKNHSFIRKKNNYYFYLKKKNRNYNSRIVFLEVFNKRNCFIKPIYVKFTENKIPLKKKDTHLLHLKNSNDINLQEDSIDNEIYSEKDENCDESYENGENDNYNSKKLDNNNNHLDNNSDYLYKSREYDLVNEYILLKKNSKSIKELMDEEKWVFPKENLNMIRKRTDKKINWNYILKKNNELLNDNIDKIYNNIYKKDNIDDIFFVFDTYPYNYLNVTMSVFSLYKFASSYLYEKKLKVSMIYEKKKDFFNNIKNENLSNDNFLSMESQDEEDDSNILKIKEERKRLNYIIKNRNFQRVVGSINKHLKIIYKIFTSNEKLTSYEKNKKVYQFIPYINIKDIITILKSFYILKYDHVNIFKYIYFYIVFFIDKFDIFNLCEAVYLCILKKIYIKSLFLNFSKYLLKYLQKNNEHFMHKEINCNNDYEKKITATNEYNDKEKTTDHNNEEEHIYNYSKENNKNNNDNINNNEEYKSNNDNRKGVKTESKYNGETFKNNEIDVYNNNNNNDIDKKRNKDNLIINKGVPNKIKINESIISLYEDININNFYNNMEKILKKKNDESNYNLLPFHLKQFDYSIYHSANYSNLNNSLDNLQQNNKNEEMEKFSAEDNRKDKINFIENKLIKKSLNDENNKYTKINFYVYVLHILSKFPYTNLKILNIIISEIMKNVNDLTLEELILSFYSIAELEYDCFKLQNLIYILIFKNLHLLNYRNKGLILKLIKSLYLTNNLNPIIDENVIKEESDNGQKFERNMKIQENENFLSYSKNSNIENVKILMINFISKMILKNINNYTPIELVDIIRYMSALNFINKELFNFVYNLPFFKNLNEDVLNIYKNNIYFNNSYYAYTKDNTINTPIEIMLCKLYQSYLSYNIYINNSFENNLNEELIKKIYKKNNEHKSFHFDTKIIQLLKNIYLNNMQISSYNSSSLHYEIADIIQKDFKIPCHVEYKASNGILIDIAILYEDFKKIDKDFPFFKNIAIEINGPFHYKTRSLDNNIPLLNTKTIFKKRLLENDNWQVISFPFWEIKPWFSKIRKEKYILKMLPEKLKSFFNN